MALEPELWIQGMSIASRMPLLLGPCSYQRKKIYVCPLTCSYTMALWAWTCRVCGPHWMDNVISRETSELTLFHSFIDHSHIDSFCSKWKPSRWLLVFSHSVLSASKWPHGLQYTKLPCPSPSPTACSNSSPLSWWYHSTSHSLSPPSPPALNLSQHQSLFQGLVSSNQVAKVLELQLPHCSFKWLFRVDFLWDGPVCPWVKYWRCTTRLERLLDLEMGEMEEGEYSRQRNSLCQCRGWKEGRFFKGVKEDQCCSNREKRRWKKRWAETWKVIQRKIWSGSFERSLILSHWRLHIRNTDLTTCRSIRGEEPGADPEWRRGDGEGLQKKCWREKTQWGVDGPHWRWETGWVWRRKAKPLCSGLGRMFACLCIHRSGKGDWRQEGQIVQWGSSLRGEAGRTALCHRDSASWDRSPPRVLWIYINICSTHHQFVSTAWKHTKDLYVGAKYLGDTSENQGLWT